MFDRIFGGGGPRIPSIPASEAAERLSAKGKGVVAPVLVDVRERYEFARGHARGAKNIPLGDLNQRLAEIPKDREVLVICQSGSRSQRGARILLNAGYERVVNVSGGMTAWLVGGLPQG